MYCYISRAGFCALNPVKCADAADQEQRIMMMVHRYIVGERVWVWNCRVVTLYGDKAFGG